MYIKNKDYLFEYLNVCFIGNIQIESPVVLNNVVLERYNNTDLGNIHLYGHCVIYTLFIYFIYI